MGVKADWLCQRPEGEAAASPFKKRLPALRSRLHRFDTQPLSGRHECGCSDYGCGYPKGAPVGDSLEGEAAASPLIKRLPALRSRRLKTIPVGGKYLKSVCPPISIPRSEDLFHARFTPDRQHAFFQPVSFAIERSDRTIK
jgi:hypothetical protein